MKIKQRKHQFHKTGKKHHHEQVPPHKVPPQGTPESLTDAVAHAGIEERFKNRGKDRHHHF